jgi:hypothetical protein
MAFHRRTDVRVINPIPPRLSTHKEGPSISGAPTASSGGSRAVQRFDALVSSEHCRRHSPAAHPPRGPTPPGTHPASARADPGLVQGAGFPSRSAPAGQPGQRLFMVPDVRVFPAGAVVQPHRPGVSDAPAARSGRPPWPARPASATRRSGTAGPAAPTSPPPTLGASRDRGIDRPTSA